MDLFHSCIVNDTNIDIGCEIADIFKTTMTTTIVPATQLPKPGDAHFGEGTETGIAIAAAADQTLKEIDVILGGTHLSFEVKNSHASVAFDVFKIQTRPQASASWQTLASIAGDYSSPQVPILEVQGAPVTLAAAASVFIRMEVEATDAVRILASGNAAATTADIHWSIQ